jgi:hypothetical protein
MITILRACALGVVFSCLRALRGDEIWKRAERFVRIGFWGNSA